MYYFTRQLTLLLFTVIIHYYDEGYRLNTVLSQTVLQCALLTSYKNLIL